MHSPHLLCSTGQEQGEGVGRTCASLTCVPGAWHSAGHSGLVGRGC